MKLHQITWILLFSVFFSCKKKDDSGGNSKNGYLMFGTFYGFCQGEECIEIFKLDSGYLFEDSKDTYPSRDTFYSGKFVALNDDKFNATKDLLGSFPMQLLNEKDTVFGCPDCADGGGIYLEYNFNGDSGFWIIDNNLYNIPKYLHSYMDEIHEKVRDLK